MLRITRGNEENGRRWTLCGQLSGPWVAELEAAWDEFRSENRLDVIDLNDVTSLDERGETLLRKMKKDGARFTARGVEMKAILKRLRDDANPALRRCLAHMDCKTFLPRREK